MLLAALAPFPVAAAGETVALVVGNARYASERLPGAADAAERLAARLEALGVEVTLVRDATRAPFERAGREFAERADGASLAIVAYAGHALRLGGSAYLVPTDVDLRSRSDLKRLPDLQRLVDTASRAERSVVVLDTCHASNFAAGWGERRYDKAPLCPGDDTGFERPSGTPLVWASDVPTPRGEGDGTGRLLERLAERLDTPSTDLIGALRAAAEASSGASVVGGDGASWPLLEPIEPAAADAPDTGRDDAVAAAPPDGLYRIANLYRSRRLGAAAGGEVALVGDGDASATDVWSLRADDDGHVVVSGAAGEGALVPDGAGVALAADREGRWRVLPIDGGLPDEFALRDADGGGWLVGDVSSGRVTLREVPGGTGWLLERFEGEPPSAPRGAPSADPPPAAVSSGVPPVAGPPGTDVPTGDPAADAPPGAARRVRLTVRPVPEDARVRITNIGPRYVPGIELWPNETYVVEVRHPDFERVVRRVTLGDEDLVLPIDLSVAARAPAPAPIPVPVPVTVERIAPPISGADRAAVTDRLEAVRAAVEARDLARLARLVPPGERLDRLVALMDTYTQIDVEIRDLLGSDDGRRLSAVLRIVRLVDAFGDTVVPPPSFRDTALYAEREGASGWSGLRWDTGSG